MNWGRFYFGTLIIVLGAILLADAADIVDAGELIGNWWPLALIGAGLLSLYVNPSHWPLGVVITAVGGALLLQSLEIADVGSLIWPTILILVGLFVIFGRRLMRVTEAGDHIRSFSIFSGTEVASHSKQFRGGSISAMFGGAEVDLRDAVPAPDARLDVFAAFGGVEIRVPEGWQVDVSGLPLFGGIENATAKETLPAEAPVLPVNATALFGGVEIKH